MIRRFREAAARAAGQADLLEAVSPHSRSGLEVRFGHEVWIIPVGDSLNEGWSLWINSTPSGFAMRLAHNVGFTVATTVAQIRARPTDAPRKLEQLIETRQWHHQSSTPPRRYFDGFCQLRRDSMIAHPEASRRVVARSRCCDT